MSLIREQSAKSLNLAEEVCGNRVNWMDLVESAQSGSYYGGRKVLALIRRQ